MCPYTLDHKQDARIHYATLNTQPHPSTEPLPPQPPRAALGQPDQERTREQHPQTGCLLRTQQCAKPPTTKTGTCSNHAAEVFHPATPTDTTQTCSTRSIRHGSSERRFSRPAGPAETRPNPRSNTPSTRWLLRKEVIQPHLPVRLPCYDFVPIASPTFDDSLPPMNQHWAG